MPSTTTGPGMAQQPLISLLAHSTSPSDLLPHLHQHAIDVTGGSSALLFQFNPRNGMLQATSAFHLDELPTDPWQPSPAEAALIDNAFQRRLPIVVADAVRLLIDRLRVADVEGGTQSEAAAHV